MNLKITNGMEIKHFFQKEKLKDWFIVHADKPRSAIALGIISFFEAIFFPIPPDFFLMAILAANRGRKWAYYSAVCSVASVLGGIVSYFIGFLFFDTLGHRIIDIYNFGPKFEATKALFQQNAFWAVLVAAITPIPDKLFNLLAGLFKINLVVFVLAYTVARATRFFLVGLLMKVFGARLAKAIYKNLGLFMIVALVAIVLSIVIAF